MNKLIAFAGKGGTGKTTTSALFINSLISTGNSPILAIDADPNTNLGEALGIMDPQTIGNMREEFYDTHEKIPKGMNKDAYIELQLNTALIEEKDFDLMVMGRQEGAGCYCYLNNILRHFIDNAVTNYPFTVVDNEAGMEHLARRTTKIIDHLIIVSDYSIKGLRAGSRILTLIDELDLQVRNKHLIVTRAPEQIDPAFNEKLEELKIDFLGYIPADETIQEFDLQQRSFFELPEDNPALKATRAMVEKLKQ